MYAAQTFLIYAALILKMPMSLINRFLKNVNILGCRFFYKVVVEINNITLEDLINKVRMYNSDEIANIKKAYHPLNVAYIFAEC